MGYTTATHRAGIYTAEEANEICNEANRNAIEDFMVPAPSQSQIEPTWPQTGDRQPALPQPSSTRMMSAKRATVISDRDMLPHRSPDPRSP